MSDGDETEFGDEMRSENDHEGRSIFFYFRGSFDVGREEWFNFWVFFYFGLN